MQTVVVHVSETSRLVEDPQLESHGLSIWTKYRGLIFGCAHALLLAIAYLIFKNLDEHYHPARIAVWREAANLIPTLFVLFFYQLFIKGENLTIFGSLLPVNSREKAILAIALVIRGVIGGLARFTSIWAQKYLSIGDNTIFHSSAPIFVVSCAAVCLGEKCGFVLSGVVSITILGIVLIVRPPLLTGQASLDIKNFHGVGLALITVLMSSFVFLLLRRLRNIHWLLVLLSSGIFGLLVNLSVAGGVGELGLPVGQRDSLLTYVALPSSVFCAQISLVLAFKFEKAGPVSLVFSSGIIFSFLLQFIFFGVVPDAYSWGGGVIVIFCIIITAARKWVEELAVEDDRKRKFQFLLY